MRERIEWWLDWQQWRLRHFRRDHVDRARRAIGLRFARTVTVRVTAEDIAAGVRFDSRRCPIARAIQRALGSDQFHVGTDGAWGQGPNRWMGPIELSPLTISYLQRYDNTGEMVPFSTTIRVPR